MSLIRSFFVVCLALLVSRPVLSEQVHGIYEAEIPVENQKSEARTVALKTAFELVLVKVSGSSTVIGDPALKDALAAPERYVRQYLYREQAQTEGHPGLGFWVLFDSGAVDALLRKHRQPVWGATRPTTVLWLTVEDRGQRLLIGAEQGPVAAVIAERARLRAVPVRLPQLDAEDLSRVRPEDIWTDAREILQNASIRYRAQAVLTGALLKVGEQYSGRFSLHQDQGTVRWQVAGSLEQAIAAALNRAADEMASAVTRTGEDPAAAVTIRVDGIRSLDDYLRATDYLRGLAGVSRASTLLVSGERVVYGLTLRGAVPALAQAISLGRVLAVDASAPEENNIAELRYKLLP